MTSASMNLKILILGATIGATTLACVSESGTAGPQTAGKVSITAAALTYTNLVDADYGIRVLNASGETVWEKASLLSSAFGDGAGALTYIGPCDASADEQPNRVELTVHALVDADGTLAETAWQNPTADGPIVRELDCVENGDVLVVFNLTLMRKAEQGFFDVAVNFEDIFCSAKVDCVDSLLHDPDTEQRSRTVNMAFACTAGGGEDTWLHMSDLLLTCGDTQIWIDPSVDPGNAGAHPPAVFQTALYRGQEELPGIDKCFWNTAIGLELGTDAANCKLTAYATASDHPFDPDGHTPDNAVYPYVAYEVDLTDANGDYVCSAHPLNGTPTGVSTDYTQVGGTSFPHQWECDEVTTITTTRTLCVGTTPGQVGAASFTNTPGGMVFSIGDNKSQAYVLEDDQGGTLNLSGCCANPCPGCSTNASSPPDPPTLCAAGQLDCDLPNCNAIFLEGLGNGDGTYAIDPDGADTGAPAFDAYCDFTTDGGGWTLVSRHYASSDLSLTAAVGTLTAPTQLSGAKLADTVINALRGDLAGSVLRMSCGDGTSYFKEDKAFVANRGGAEALQDCAASWDAAVWYSATPYPSHNGLNTYQVDTQCGGYQIWNYDSSGTCYPSGNGDTWVKGTYEASGG
jgi:hypothetical protein